jgi:hypothetical protein
MLELLSLEWAGEGNPSCPAATLAEETTRWMSVRRGLQRDPFKKVGVKDTEFGYLLAAR